LNNTINEYPSFSQRVVFAFHPNGID